MREVEHGGGHAHLVAGAAQGTELGVELAGQTRGDVPLHRCGGSGRLGVGHAQGRGDRVGGGVGGQVVTQCRGDGDDLAHGPGEGISQVAAQDADRCVRGGTEGPLDDDEGDLAPQLGPDGARDPGPDSSRLQGLNGGAATSGGSTVPLPQGQGTGATDGADLPGRGDGGVDTGDPGQDVLPADGVGEQSGRTDPVLG